MAPVVRDGASVSRRARRGHPRTARRAAATSTTSPRGMIGNPQGSRRTTSGAKWAHKPTPSQEIGSTIRRCPDDGVSTGPHPATARQARWRNAPCAPLHREVGTHRGLR